MKATEVTADLAESNGSLPPDGWLSHLRADSLYTGSAPGPTLGNEYGKTLPLFNVSPKIKVIIFCPFSQILNSDV